MGGSGGGGFQPTASGWLRITALAAGLAFASYLLFFCDLVPGQPVVTRAAAVAVLMATLWVTEAVPLVATALIPLSAFPLLGIEAADEVAKQYVSSTVFLYVGGLMVALAMERTNLHRRIALGLIGALGTSPPMLLAGFMLTCALLSMFISNTATTMMMTTIVLAILTTVEQNSASKDSQSRTDNSRLAVGLLLGIAYASSIGGVATIVGTPTNLTLVQFYKNTYPDAPPITFAGWLFMAAPISTVLLVVAWLLLSQLWLRKSRLSLGEEFLPNQLRMLGAWTWAQCCVLAIFLALILLWVSRSPIDIGFVVVPGWSTFLPSPKFATDGCVAMAAAALLFVLPKRDGTKHRILDAEAVRQLPWDMILLIGGGFALAGGFASSGLSTWVSEQLIGLRTLPPILIVAVICLVLSLLTELTSNVATSATVLPLLSALSESLGVEPLSLMIPATITCSFAFMLPVATPPNAIVFGTGRITIGQMMKTGISLNLLAVVLITLASLLW